MLSEFITCQFGTLHVFPLLVYPGPQLVRVRGKSGVTPYKTLQHVDAHILILSFLMVPESVEGRWLKPLVACFLHSSEVKWLPRDPRCFCDCCD
jgi:hypothetical protein